MNDNPFIKIFKICTWIIVLNKILTDRRLSWHALYYNFLVHSHNIYLFFIDYIIITSSVLAKTFPLLVKTDCQKWNSANINEFLSMWLSQLAICWTIRHIENGNDLGVDIECNDPHGVGVIEMWRGVHLRSYGFFMKSSILFNVLF